MIVGIGVDLCAVHRFEQASEHFLARVFSEGEQAYVGMKGVGQAAAMAGLFAAKEAFLKALGVGLGAVPLADIEVAHHDGGAPCYAVSGKALEALHARGIAQAHLSISHDGGMAAAFCVLET